MAYKKLEAFAKRVADLSDTPSSNMTPSEIKAWFDASSEELRLLFNETADLLNVDKSILTNAVQNIESLQGLTTTQRADINKVLDEMQKVQLEVIKSANNLVYDYSKPISVSSGGIPYMFFVNDDGILGVEEKDASKVYHSGYIKSPNGSTYQVYVENDGTLKTFKLY